MKENTVKLRYNEEKKPNFVITKENTVKLRYNEGKYSQAPL